jgi:parallel beta-helix repeat protein
MKNSIVVFLLFLTASSFALTTVSSCQTINAPDVYVLNQSLSGDPVSMGSGTGCINIATSNVVLDCDGHSVSGPGTASTYGIHAGGSLTNITIRNCTVSDYFYGIDIDTTDGALVENNEVSGTNDALTIGHLTYHVTSRNNEFHSSERGIDLEYSSSSGFISERDYIHDNDQYGIRLSGTSGIIIANGTIEENGGYDIYTSLAFSSDCGVSVDNITGSGGRPIMFINDSAEVSDVELSELILCGADGVNITNVTVRGSETLDNNGIFMQISSNVNIINSNSSNNEYGVFAYYTDDLTIRDSSFIANEYDGVQASQGNRNVFSGIVANDNGDSGVYINSPSTGNDIQNNSAHRNGENGFVVNDASGVFVGNNASFNGEDGFYFFIENMDVLNNNASWNNGTGIFTEASDNVVYENNYLCDNMGSGLDLGKSAPGNLVRGNTACRNGQGGFVLSSPKGASDNNVFEDNTAFENEDGFVINSTVSRGNNIRNNIARDNANSGFMLDGSSGNTIEWNNASGNPAGFLFVAGSNDNNVYNNRAYEGSDGFRFLGSSDNIMFECIAHDNMNTGFYERYGLGDSGGVAATTIINSRFYNNGWEIVQASAYGRQFNVTNSTLGSSSVRFSMLDEVDGDVLGIPAYMINETGSPGARPAGNSSFWGKYVKVFYDSDQRIDMMTFHWDDDEAQPFDESTMLLLTWNGTGWIQTPGQSLDEGSNSLEALSLTNITEDDYYGIFISSPAEGADNDGESDRPLSVEMETSCEGNTITVTSGQENAGGARVVINGLLEGFTDSDGEFGFPGCGETLLVYVNKNGYLPAQETFTLVNCSSCQGECDTDSQCPDSMQCLEGECEEVPCPCGSVTNHACASYECCDDYDCEGGQSCLGHSCTEIPLDECADDNDCASSQYCESGECSDVSGECGYADNHSWVSYQCGDAAGCPGCDAGFACEGNVCVEYNISGPESGTVGARANITANKKDGPCSGCDLQITSPSGKKSTGKTGPDGSFELGLLEIGDYRVALVKDGETIAGIKVASLGVEREFEEGKPEEMEICPLPIIILVLVVLAIAAYMALRKKK